MSRLLESLSAAAKEKISESRIPSSPRPMLATLTDERFSDASWIYERKLDGERCLAVRDGRTTRLLSRNGERLDDTYPELADALARQATSKFVVDGEIVAFQGKLTSFSRLQQRMQLEDPEEARPSKVKVYYYLFDLLHLEGHDVTALGLRQRKALLRPALRYDDPIRFTIHRNHDGEAFFRQACDKGWEGIIAKEADSEYVHSRSRKWLKFKCVNQQEFVVGGYTDPEGERIGFGALLLGYYREDELIYAGKVGTGYDDRTLKRLSQRLHSIRRETPPFAQDDLPSKGVHWVTPKLVAEIGFTEWTEDGKLRHPRFLGLRSDKKPGQVVRETAS